MAIEGRVARILSDTTAALNVGTEHNVSVGDVVTISNRVMIQDPITHEDLGEVDVERLSAKIISVKPRVSVAQVTSTYTRAGSTFIKSITDDPDLEDFRTVHVKPSDFVEVTKNAWSDREPPF